MSKREIRSAAAKGGAPPENEDEDNADDDARRGGEPGDINLEHGLDICLNMEIDQTDPGGATMPYRMLVPALWYEGPPDANDERFRTRGRSFMDRLRGMKRRGSQESYSGSERSLSPGPAGGRGPEDQLPQQQQAGAGPGAAGPGWTPTATGGVRMPSSNSQPQQSRQSYDGAYEHPPPPAQSAMAGGRRSLDHGNGNGVSAYDRGLAGSQPPIGGANNQGPYPPAPQQRQQGQGRGIREGEKHAQFTTAPPSTTGPGPYRRDQRRPYPDEEHGSLTPSEEFDDDGGGYYEDEYEGETQQPRRRFGSKAERFFGIGEPSPGNGGGGYDGEEGGGKGKRRWMIWK